jgi:hypothetical protein
MAMKFGLTYKILVYWLVVNAVMTICFGLLLAVICLFPDTVPALRNLIVEGPLARFIPYVIFLLIVSSLVSLSFYYDSPKC